MKHTDKKQDVKLIKKELNKFEKKDKKEDLKLIKKEIKNKKK